ncbi:MAG: YceI family protein [Alphaproteobacteria bacterium]|nr:YceI family protein [Alphaproteobacteria bacterium]
MTTIRGNSMQNLTTRSLVFAAAFAMIASPLLALEQPPAVKNSAVPSLMETGTYDLDPTHAIIEFGVSHLGFSLYRGRFNTASGTLEWNSAEPEKSSVSVTVEVASIDTPSDKLDAELTGAEVFDAAQFPQATFKSTGATRTSDTTGTLTGDLTIKGVTKPITLAVTFNGSGQHPMLNTAWSGFTATGSFKRSDFGIVNWAQAVGDTVELRLDIEFGKKQ